MNFTTSIEEFEKGPVSKVSFQNGCVLIYHHTPYFEGSCANIWFISGSRNEPRGKEGLAHLLEHLMYRGPISQKIDGPQFEELEGLGVETNAFTSKEYMFFELHCLSRKILAALELYLQVILSPRFDEATINSEKKIISQELREDRSDLESLIGEKSFEKGFSADLGHSIGGTTQSLKNISKKDLEKFYNNSMTPNKLVVSITSKNPLVEFQTLLMRVFSNIGWTKTASAFRFRQILNSKPIRSFKSSIKKNYESSSVILKSNGPTIFDPLRGAYYLIDSYLCDGVTSVLFKKLRAERSLVYHVASHLNFFSDCGSLEISFSSRPQDWREVKKIVEEVFLDLAQNGLKREIKEKVIKNLIENWELSFDDMNEVNTHLALSEIYWGKTQTLKNFSEMLRSVSDAEIKSIAKKIVKNGFSFVVINP
jgi:predicted Zn-dependent peptidase